uniref:Uncharacterized protein n=1 Tax=Trichogramma kaykai TaxID=54128 RepID=A0ABD2VT66_9HYME
MPWIKCLSSGSSSGGRNASAAAASADHRGSASNNKTSRAASKKQLSISQPVHLLVKVSFSRHLCYNSGRARSSDRFSQLTP